VSAERGPRDWDKELAQIDKLIASGSGGQQPPAPAPGAAAPAARKGGGAPAAGPPAAEGRSRAAFVTWVRLLLGLLVGIGITQWPYQRACGVLLLGYLVAVAGVIVAGLWSALSSWRSRSSLAHVLSLGLLAWGGVLGAREVLPRVGYAKAGATWMCPARAAAPKPAPSPAPAPQPPTTTPGAS
jgi:hypothetical protein